MFPFPYPRVAYILRISIYFDIHGAGTYLGAKRGKPKPAKALRKLAAEMADAE